MLLYRFLIKMNTVPSICLLKDAEWRNGWSAVILQLFYWKPNKSLFLTLLPGCIQPLFEITNTQINETSGINAKIVNNDVAIFTCCQRKCNCRFLMSGVIAATRIDKWFLIIKID